MLGAVFTMFAAVCIRGGWEKAGRESRTRRKQEKASYVIFPGLPGRNRGRPDLLNFPPQRKEITQVRLSLFPRNHLRHFRGMGLVDRTCLLLAKPHHRPWWASMGTRLGSTEAFTFTPIPVPGFARLNQEWRYTTDK
jgi:hypothetical protein